MECLAFYNATRLHSTLGYVSPMRHERNRLAAQENKSAKRPSVNGYVKQRARSLFNIYGVPFKTKFLWLFVKEWMISACFPGWRQALRRATAGLRARAVRPAVASPRGDGA
jgi:hypothetical protein